MLDLRMWDAYSIGEDEGKDRYDESVEKKVGKKSYCHRRDDEDCIRSPAETIRTSTASTASNGRHAEGKKEEMKDQRIGWRVRVGTASYSEPRLLFDASSFINVKSEK